MSLHFLYCVRYLVFCSFLFVWLLSYFLMNKDILYIIYILSLIRLFADECILYRRTHARVRFYLTFVSFNVLYLELLLCFSQIKIHSFIHSSSLGMIELFYSKIYMHSASGQIHGLCASIALNMSREWFRLC